MCGFLHVPVISAASCSWSHLERCIITPFNFNAKTKRLRVVRKKERREANATGPGPRAPTHVGGPEGDRFVSFFQIRSDFGQQQQTGYPGTG
eukprot:3556132-Rhodomonas_salina.1